MFGQYLICLFNLTPMAIRLDLSDYGKCQDAKEADFHHRQYDNIVEIPAYGLFFGNIIDL